MQEPGCKETHWFYILILCHIDCLSIYNEFNLKETAKFHEDTQLYFYHNLTPNTKQLSYNISYLLSIDHVSYGHILSYHLWDIISGQKQQHSCVVSKMHHQIFVTVLLCSWLCSVGLGLHWLPLPAALFPYPKSWFLHPCCW